MKTKIFNKNELIFHYTPSPFPKNKIPDDILVHKELILSENGEEPEIVNQSKKGKYTCCYVIEEELERIKGISSKKGQQNKVPYRGQNKPNNWRKNEEEDNSGGFFDEFKGKTDEKQVCQFKRNLANFLSQEGSISIINSVFIDHLSKDSYINMKPESLTNITKVNDNSTFGKNSPNTTKRDSKEINSSDACVKNLKTTTISADNFFENADQILAKNNNLIATSNQQINSENKNEQSSNDKNNIQIAKPAEEFNIKNIYKVNEYLQYPKDEPLWYIFHPTAKSSFGPITSINIEEMFNGRMLSEKSEIRFIDIYNLKNKKPFAFFALKEISHSGFINEIDISSLLRVAVSIKSREVTEKQRENISNVTEINDSNPNPIKTNLQPTIIQNSKDTIKNPDKDANNEQKQPKDEVNQNSSLHKPKATNSLEGIYSPESIYNISSHQSKENNQVVENIYDVYHNSEKKGGKKNKGKPVELDVKLGK